MILADAGRTRGDSHAADGWDGMAWTAPLFSKAQVDAAGRTLINPAAAPPERDAALEVINNWRSSHSFPLNTFQVTLRNKGRRVDPDCLVAQRIKRLSSIALKLRRFAGLRLSQIQDIGGCRAVVFTIDEVRELVNVYKKSDLKHTLTKIDDYLAKPQPSGYRGIHLIYRYFSDKKATAYNGLRIELQIRSQFQHAWATAVETVGTFIRQALKSSMGEADWLRFFTLMGTVIAFQEGTAAVDDTPTDHEELIEELRFYSQRLEVAGKLEAYGNALQFFQGAGEAFDSHYYLLELDAGEKSVTVSGYKKTQLDIAQRNYLAAEKRIAEHPASEAVLVSVDSLAALQRAYPNYFLDTRIFIDLLRDALEGKPLAVEEPSRLVPSNPDAAPS